MLNKDWGYGPSVYWFWSRVPTQAEIKKQVRQIARAGYRTLLIQARLSMPLEVYLSPEYLDAYRRAIKLAQAESLYAGIYDDYNWMSGQAGGRSVQANPSIRERHLFWSGGQVRGEGGSASITDIHSLMYEGFSEAAMRWAYQDGQVRWGDWQIFRVLAVPPGDQPVDPGQAVDISAHARLESNELGCEIRLNLPDAALDGWRFFAFVHAQCASSRMINYLDPAAAQTFIQVGLEPFARAVGDFFGSTIQYTFFDHPYCGFYSWREHTGGIGNSLMFTPALPERFQAERGYTIEQALLSFLVDSGPSEPHYRCDFFETYGRLGRESFFDPLRNWSHEHGLLQSGHELLGFVGAWGITQGFAALDVRTNFGGDYFDIDRYKDLSAVDACNYHSQISPVFGASVAKANGKQGCLIEQYAVAGTDEFSSAAGNWGLSLADLRRQAMRFLIQGASHFIFHAFYLDDGKAGVFDPLGNPRFDFPPGINFEPWFRYHDIFAREYRAVCHKLQGATSAANDPTVAVLYPLRTYWTEGSQADFSSLSGEIFQRLSQMGVAFDIIDERQVERWGRSGKFPGYQWLILPAVSVVHSKKTLRALRVYLEAGGHILAAGKTIRATQVDGVLPEGNATLQRLLRHPGFHRVAQPVGSDWLDEALAETMALPDLPPQGGWFRRLTTPAGDWVFLFNDSQSTARYGFSATGRVASVSPFSGTRTPYSFYQNAAGGNQVQVDLKPDELRIFYLAAGEPSANPLALRECSARVENATVLPHQLIVQALAENEVGIDLEIQAASAPTQVSGNGVTGFSCTRLETGLWKVTPSLDPEVKPLEVPGPWKLITGSRSWEGLPNLEQSWEELGLKHYKGEGRYYSTLNLTQVQASLVWRVEFPQYSNPVALIINGLIPVILSTGQPYLDIKADFLMAGINRLELSTFNNADAYYYHRTPYTSLIRGQSGRIGCLRWIPRIDLTLAFDESQ